MNRKVFIMGFGSKSLLLAVLTALTVAIPAIENNGSLEKNLVESREEIMIRYRLPNNTIPRLYRIKIEPNLTDEKLTWSGESSIDFEVLRETKIITLHAHNDLAIDENFTSVVDSDGNEHKPIQQSRDDEVEFFKLGFERDIPVGNYSINLRYNGVDPERPVGFYKASFESSRPIAATHFEATTARRAFPCWDEPGLKARFSLAIKHHSKYKAISNTPEIERIELGDGKILTNFETTPMMSTYLLTFVIADYESVSNEFGNVTLWADKYQLEDFVHVLNTSQRVVDFMEAYTGLKFGVSRIGSVVIPLFPASATEHWGLVSYNIRMIRFDRSITTTMTLDRINLLIAHELSHSWFGNRVSPLWWNDLWLNEAFAAYFQYVIMDEINGNSKKSELFVVRNNQQISFSLDLDESNIYVRWTPITNTEIRKLFGPTTYRKGAAILHMFRNVLTDDVFRSGLRKYLTKHSYSAAEASDLMTALQEAYDESGNTGAPFNVKDAMMTWLMQTGCPIINVTRNYTTGDTNITQSSLNGNTTKKWWIPLNYVTKTDLNFSTTTPSRWMNNENDSVTISGIDKEDWVIFNVQASGYYRVNYDDENWKRIVNYMNTDNYKNIHALNRAQLLNDAHYLAEREPSRYNKFFWQLTKYLSREDEYTPWNAVKAFMKYIDSSITGTKIHDSFKKYILGLMNSLVVKVGYETHDDDDYMTKITKADLVEWACVLGHAGCIEFSTQRLLRYVENPKHNQLHPDNKVAIFCAGLRGLNDTATKRVVHWALENEMDLLHTNLGCTENHEVHRNFLNSLSHDNFKERLVFRAVLDSILKSSDENFNFIIDFLLETNGTETNNDTNHSWDHLRDFIVAYIPAVITTKARLEKYKLILDLDIITKNQDTSRSNLLNKAERTVADKETTTTILQALWDEHLFPDNLVNNKNINTH